MMLIKKLADPIKAGCILLGLLVSSVIVPLSAVPVSAQSTGSPENPQGRTSVYVPLVSQIYDGKSIGSGSGSGGGGVVTDRYYVDSVNGSDANSGISEVKPWKSLAPVHAAKFSPGSVVHFKRGSSWTGNLVIDDSGVEGNPIVFTAYGSGSRPVFQNPGDKSKSSKVIVINADWVIVEGLQVQNSFANGVHIAPDSDYNIVQDMDISDVGIGIYVYGQHNLITKNSIHDLHIIVNTAGGTDDYGATGVGLSNSFNEISYNRIFNCIDTSYDFGVDGGAVEWWGTADGNYVHHNWASGNDGFLEVAGGSARNSIVAYNVSHNNRRFAAIHLDGSNKSIVENFRIENNTIVEPAADVKRWDILYFDASPAQNTVLFRNNIVYADWFSYISNKPGFTHSHNLYYLSSGTLLGFDLGANEQIADPLFINLAKQDFHLQPTSPAINAGLNLGASLDMDNRVVPSGGAPDLGAYEHEH